MDDGCPMSPTSDITDVRECPIGQYPLMSAVMVSLSMAAMLDYYYYYYYYYYIIIRILLIIVRRRRRRRRAVAPTSNTASHDYHEKIS